jgi:hypothetical protein
MRARHGGLTEGYSAIAEKNPEVSLTDLRFHGQHRNLKTQIKHYIDGRVQATRRVAERRALRHLRRARDAANGTRNWDFPNTFPTMS